MIAFTLEGNDGKILGLGLTDENIEAIKEGKPLLKEVGKYCKEPLDKIFLLYGKTDFAMMNQLKQQGILGKESNIHPDGFLR